MKNITRENIKEAILMVESDRLEPRAAGLFIAQNLVSDGDVTSIESVDWVPTWVMDELKEISRIYTETGELFTMGSTGLVDISDVGDNVRKLFSVPIK